MASGTNSIGVYYKASDSKIYPGSDNAVSITFGAAGIAVTTNVWYRIDVKVSTSANPWTCDIQVDGVALTQHTLAVAANTSTACSLGGSFGAITADYFIDDFVLSNTSGDYPIGAGFIEGFVPNADGTHTFTTTIGVRGTTGAPTGGGNIAGSTDSFNWLNARPIGGGVADATRLWNQQSNGATLYGEVQFEDHTGQNAPRAVEVLTIQKDAGTGNGDSTFKINDNGTEATVFATGTAAGITTDTARTKQFATAPSTGGAWTLALFNGLRFRFGYSGDANPDHYCRGVMIEAEFPPEPPAGTPWGPIGQSLHHQILGR